MIQGPDVMNVVITDTEFRGGTIFAPNNVTGANSEGQPAAVLHPPREGTPLPALSKLNAILTDYLAKPFVKILSSSVGGHAAFPAKHHRCHQHMYAISNGDEIAMAVPL